MSPPSRGTETVARSHSRRLQKWFVLPVAEDSDQLAWQHDDLARDAVECGHLFNASVERSELGIGEGHGEECCIALEPIADVRLSFAPSACVKPSNPELTGVQLLCGHRFSAVSLLWHWCLSPMMCPVCRASYSTRSAGQSRSARKCKIENFPRNIWRTLRGMALRIADENAADETRESIQFIFNNIAQDNVISALGDSDNLYLAFSMETANDTHTLRFLPLVRTPAADTAGPADLVHFTVPRPSVRRFASAMLREGGSWTSGTMRASVMMRVGYGHDDASVMLPVAQITDVALPIPSILQEEDVPDVHSRVSMDVVSIGPANPNTSTESVTDLSNTHFTETDAEESLDSTESLVQSMIDPTSTGVHVPLEAEPFIEPLLARMQSSFANVVMHPAVSCRVTSVSVPCDNTEGCMTLRFLQVPDVVTYTLLSVSMSVSPDAIMQSVSGYFSSGVIIDNESYS